MSTEMLIWFLGVMTIVGTFVTLWLQRTEDRSNSNYVFACPLENCTFEVSAVNAYYLDRAVATHLRDHRDETDVP